MTDRSESDADHTERDMELAALTEEITRRMHAGEAVDLEDYAVRYPKLVGPMRRLLPTLRQLAQFGRPHSMEMITGGETARATNETAELKPSPWKPTLSPRTLDIES